MDSLVLSNSHTLVLSNSYMPISRVPWQKAITWVVLGRAEIVEQYGDAEIHAAQAVFPMPSVVRFLHNIRGLFRKGVKFNRKNVWLRDQGRCQYCGDKVPMSDFTFDHVYPQSKGGMTRWDNIVVACHGCNQRKGHKTLREVKMKLRSLPVKPKSLPGVSFPAVTWGDGMPQTWKDYLGSHTYWNSALSE